MAISPAAYVSIPRNAASSWTSSQDSGTVLAGNASIVPIADRSVSYMRNRPLLCGDVSTVLLVVNGGQAFGGYVFNGNDLVHIKYEAYR
ncbi:hypothetical protein M422DRAFT_270604 [Sphaerobolus stellatus SS14]|uniref:Uncharacterized protein n=1 Tax=Sphaerobolus stellatus (strain SS14) TaxID=990650 RepID=A0A0C9UGT8_SPHS4|nr:hypothetical protein M422DRAFT_270604 [Sphaerobolus stellatus SS14]